MSASWAAHAQQYAYSPDMIRALVPNGQDVDVSFFEKGYGIPPGTYQFELKVNGDLLRVANYEVREYEGQLQPVLTVKDLKTLPLKKEVLEKFSNVPENQELFPLSSSLDWVKANVDTDAMKIDISIPQVSLENSDGWIDVVDPELWDYGENAALINYTLTGNHTKSRSSDYDSTNLYANLSGRLNIGAWRLYTSGSFYANKTNAFGNTETTQEWDMWNTYLQRDIPAWKGTLQIGELSTSSEIFDSIPLRGARISTNVQMLSRRDRSYSPVIEGIANTNAQVIIRQNNHVIHTLNVAPGPFKLDDLPAFGDYGDLEVIIKEADGTERVLNIPYSSVPNMLREGQYRYDVNVGRYYYKNIGSDVEKPLVFMGSLSYGLPFDMTVYGGSILSEGYAAFAVGTGASLGSYGAIAADVVQTHHASDAARGLDSGSGAAWRVRYEKNMLSTGTTVNLANYQYITGNYATLQDIVEYNSAVSSRWWGYGRVQSRWQLSMNQQLGRFGSFSLGADYSTYHGESPDTKSFNVSYGTAVMGVGVSLNYARNYMKLGGKEGGAWDSNHTVMLNLNIPLSLFFRNNTNDLLSSTSVSYQGSMEKSMGGEKTYRQSVVMSGFHGDSGLNWTLAQELGNSDERATSLSMSYSGDRLHANWGADRNKSVNSYHLGVSGALLLHRTGITVAGNAYDSMAIIEVPDAKGVRISQAFGTETDMFGHGVLTYLNNYTRNEFSIDPATLPDGAILLDSTNRVVIPTQGAVVRVKYPVRFGKQAVFILHDKNGTPLPFGATVDLMDEDGNKDRTVTGLIGEGGRVYLSGIPESGTLRVLQDKSIHTFNYKVSSPVKDKNDEFTPIEVITLTSMH